MVHSFRYFVLAIPLLLLPIGGCAGAKAAAMPPSATAVSAGASAAGSNTTLAVTLAPNRSVNEAGATTPAPNSYWSGTISDISTNGIIANCGKSNFAEGYGCLPVVTTGATISGNPVPGQYFQMWGDLSKLPNITATTINYGSSAFPTTAGPTPSPVVATSSYWAGTVSDVNPTGIIANCGQSNFAAGYGCLPVVTTGAKSTGTPVSGQYFQLWGDLSKLPNITASIVNYSAAPFPSTMPSAAPIAKATTAAVVAVATPAIAAATAAPTIAPIVAVGSSGTYMNLQNASDAAASFTPYAGTSVWRTPVSSNPTFASYSAAVVNAQFPSIASAGAVRANEAGQYDYYHPRFFATTSDPLVRVVCTTYCGAPDNGGVPAQIRIPAKARPAGGGDSHFDIVQPDGTEITMWAATRPSSDWSAGATVTAANVANCGSYTTGQGWLAGGPGPTAAGYCDSAGVVTAAELIAGQINHALFVSGQCAVGSQYPAENGAATDRCTSGVGPPLGGHEWYDVPCATTQASTALKPWEKAILCALNQYGGYMGDDGGGGANFTGGIGPELESEEPWYDFFGPGYTSPFAALAAQGWYSFPINDAHPGAPGMRWVGADPWEPAGVDFRSHVHWLDPCSAHGTC